jgi:hypothetical protein
MQTKPFSDYLVFVDESGSPSMGRVDPDFPLLVLAFMIVRKDEYAQQVVPAVQSFKFQHFGHDQVILHERDIRRDLGPFSFLKTRTLKQAFLDELTGIVEKVPFHLVSVVIRKDALQKRYTQPENPYHLALQYGLERISAFLHTQGEWQTGAVSNPKVHLVVEQRGRNEDDELELEFRRICDRGNFNQELFAFEVIRSVQSCRRCHQTKARAGQWTLCGMGLKGVSVSTKTKAPDNRRRPMPTENPQSLR